MIVMNLPHPATVSRQQLFDHHFAFCDANAGPGSSTQRAMMTAYREKVNFWKGNAQKGATRVVEVTSQEWRPRMKRILPAIKRRRREKREDMKQRSKIDPWWQRPATKSGEACTTAQERLSKPENYTGVSRKSHPEPHKLTALSGDYYPNPRKAAVLLQGSTYQELTLSKRAADFTAQVRLRLNLRA